MLHALPEALTAALDELGSFVFALSGGLLAVEKRFDLFGVLLLSFVVAVTGGITRDLLIGAVPPAAVASWHTLAIAAFAGLLTFTVYPAVRSHKRDVLLFDAVGLAVFAVTGAQKALQHGIDPVMAAVLGMVSGIGGGIMRDVLAGEVPTVLRADLYALAALAAAGIVSLGEVPGATHEISLACCALTYDDAPSRLWGSGACRSRSWDSISWRLRTRAAPARSSTA